MCKTSGYVFWASIVYIPDNQKCHGTLVVAQTTHTMLLTGSMSELCRVYKTMSESHETDFYSLVHNY